MSAHQRTIQEAVERACRTGMVRKVIFQRNFTKEATLIQFFPNKGVLLVMLSNGRNRKTKSFHFFNLSNGSAQNPIHGITYSYDFNKRGRTLSFINMLRHGRAQGLSYCT